MSNLPISNSPAAAIVPAKSSAPTEDGNAPSGPTFGAVLARQVATPETADGKTPAGKAVGKNGKDGITELLAADPNTKNEPAAVDATPSNAPTTDLLAALLPQVMATTTTATTATGTAKAAGEDALRTVLAGRKESSGLAARMEPQGLPGAKTDPSASATANTASDRSLAAKAASNGLTFAAALDARSAGARTELASAGEKADALLNAVPRLPDAATMATMQNTAPQIAATGALPSQLVINTPVTQDRWGDEFNQKITWLATSKEQSAELHLNPPDLGPLDVVLKVSGDQATAMFTSPHAAVRDAIEQAMPKLREMLADNGIMLGNATVNDQAARDQSRQNEFANRSENGGAGRSEDAGMTAAGTGAVRVTPLSRNNNVVDTFA